MSERSVCNETQISLKREKITPHVPDERRDVLCTWPRASLTASPGGRGLRSPKACSVQFYRKRRDPGQPCLQAKLDEETQAPRGPPQAAQAVPSDLRPRSLSCDSQRPHLLPVLSSAVCCAPRLLGAEGLGGAGRWRSLGLCSRSTSQELYQDTGDSQCSWVLAPVKTQGQKLLSRGPRTRTPGPRGVCCRAGGPAGLAGGRGTLGQRGKGGSSRAPGHPWDLRGPGELPPPEEPTRA